METMQPGQEENVFVVGSSRSGTTLLASIIEASGQYAQYRAEPKLMAGCQEKYGPLTSTKARRRFLADWYASRQFRRSGLTEDEFLQFCLTPDVQSYADLLRRFMRVIAGKQGRYRWIDGTPENATKLPEIARYFPNSRVIHMIRDGRAVALSLTHLGWSPAPGRKLDRAITYAALKWEHSVKSARASAHLLGNRYKEVHYERLVTEPDAVIGELGEFLELPALALPEVLTPAAANEAAVNVPRRTNSAFDDMGAGLTTTAVERWKSKLTPEQIRCVEEYVGATLEELGYPIVFTAEPRISKRVLSAWARFLMVSRRYAKRQTVLGRLSASPLEVGLE